jgi:6,7-dimethyl-8-ribityllumazine synthase
MSIGYNSPPPMNPVEGWVGLNYEEKPMVKKIEGNLDGKGLKIAIVQSRFNEFIVNRLYEGAIDGLTRHGVKDADITQVLVPGSFEIPLTTKRVAESGKYDAVIAIGCVMRGDTPHNVYIAAEVTKGIAQVSIKTGVPIVFGILTPDSLEQAIERAGTKSGNKGYQAAMAAIEIVNTLKGLG